MSIQDAIKFDCQGLPVGASTRIYCPACSQHDMGVTRNADGILYNCHRASCGIRGFTGTAAHSLNVKPADKKVPPYTGELLPLFREDYEFFEARYELSLRAIGDHIWRNRNDEYVLPIEWDGKIRGYNVRQPWDGSPRAGRSGQPKSKVWMHSEKPIQAVYNDSPGEGFLNRVVLVEDQLSAIKVAACLPDQVVCLLGTHLNIERVREIAMLKPTEVIIALDADATSLAFKHARDFGLAFQKCRVAILEQDLKDTKMADIPTVLGL